MEWVVEYTDEFEIWWDSLTEDEQVDVNASVELLEERGPKLPYPHSSGVKGSKHSHMRELRIQHQGDPYRVLYAMDPRRTSILLLGGNKVGDEKRWYKKNVPVADNLYDRHIAELKKEKLIGDDDG